MKKLLENPKIIIGLGFLAMVAFLVSACSGLDFVPLKTLDSDTTQIDDGQGDNNGNNNGNNGGDLGNLDVLDEFTQGSNDKVDILWVIDNSRSMDEEQQAIADNAAAFTQKLLDANSDFQVAVVTTNASNDNELVSLCKDDLGQPLDGNGIITPATADRFADCAKVGISGSGLEEGLEAARRAVDSSYDCGSGVACNPDFIRSDATLHVVFVSDEEDQPRANVGDIYAAETVTQELYDLIRLPKWWQDVEDNGRGPDGKEAYFPLIESDDAARMTHLRFFSELKAGQDIRMHAITLAYTVPIGDPDTCHQSNNKEEASLRYPYISNKTAGTTSDICGDWEATMDAIGLESSGQSKCFKLSAHPLNGLEGINQVLLNDVGNSDWYYDSEPNAVCFYQRPAIGDNIKVYYERTT